MDLAVVFMENRSSASDSAYSYFSVAYVVCLSVVCHIRASCLNHSMDSHATWRHFVRWGPRPSREREIWGLSPQSTPALAYVWFTRGQHWSAISRLTELLLLLVII